MKIPMFAKRKRCSFGTSSLVIKKATVHTYLHVRCSKAGSKVNLSAPGGGRGLHDIGT
jgi:hypothetical protein